MSLINRRRRRVTVRGRPVTEQDWRGMLAILTTIGYFSTVATALLRFGFSEAIATLGFVLTPEMLVLNWYFRAKEDMRT